MPKLLIEISCECNRRVVFQPTQDKLRGRWDTSRVGFKRAHEVLTRLPSTIPGINIGVDTATRTLAIFDPLESSENKKILEAIRQAKEDLPGLCSGSEPRPKMSRKSVSDTELKTWIYWMKRLVDGGMAIMLEGEMPDMEEIEAMKGKIVVSQMNVMATRQITKGDFDGSEQSLEELTAP